MTAVYLQPGIIEADKQFDENRGLLFVTFQSVGVKTVPTCLKSGSALNDDPVVAFQGGAAAPIYRDRISNVNGLRTYVVTVMMKLDGSALLDDGNENLVNSWQVYLDYPNQKTPPAVGQQEADPTHSAMYGVKLAERLKAAGVEAVVSYPGQQDTKYGSISNFLITKLKAQ